MPVARHVCDNCGAAVADEQFCPNCGAWIDPLVEGASHDDGDTVEDFEEFSLRDTPPAGGGAPMEDEPPRRVRMPQSEIPCPSCGTPNPATNRHCEECGARLAQGALPVAPRPAVQATAGVRAAMAISALLLGVVVIAVLFNIIAGGDETPETTLAATTTTTTPAVEPAPIDILSVNCSVAGISGFECRNLIDTGDLEYQINWESLDESQDVTIELIFAEPMVVTGFEWENLPEGDRFYQNYRARGISVSDGAPNAVALPLTLDDQPGAQFEEYASLRTLKLEITVDTVYLPQERNGQIFTELAVEGIRVIGYPAPTADTTTTTATTGTTGG